MVYCPRDHLMNKFDAESNCDKCRSIIDGNHYGCERCDNRWDICENCLNKSEELDCNWEKQDTCPDEIEKPNSGNEPKEAKESPNNIENPNPSNETKDSPYVENQDSPDDCEHPNSSVCQSGHLKLVTQASIDSNNDFWYDAVNLDSSKDVKIP